MSGRPSRRQKARSEVSLTSAPSCYVLRKHLGTQASLRGTCLCCHVAQSWSQWKCFKALALQEHVLRTWMLRVSCLPGKATNPHFFELCYWFSALGWPSEFRPPALTFVHTSTWRPCRTWRFPFPISGFWRLLLIWLSLYLQGA